MNLQFHTKHSNLRQIHHFVIVLFLRIPTESESEQNKAKQNQISAVGVRESQISEWCNKIKRLNNNDTSLAHSTSDSPRHSRQIDRLLFIILFILLFNAKYYHKKGTKLWEQNVFVETKDSKQQQMCDKWCEINQKQNYDIFCAVPSMI